MIARNSDEIIFVNDHPKQNFSKCTPEGRLSPVSLWLFAEFLKSSNKKNQQAVKDITDTYGSGSFREQIKECIYDHQTHLLQDNLDRKITLYTKLFGKSFIIDYVKKLLNSDENHKVERVTFFFAR